VSKKTTQTRKRALAAVACGVAILVAGCGSDDEGQQIPQSSVAELERSLESIERRFELGGGACQDITQGDDTDVDVVQSRIDALPDDVDKDVRDALQESFDRLFDLVQQECSQADTETETTPTEEVPPVTETVPTVTETVPTETTPPPTNTTPDDQGQGTGGGGGGGNNGNGGGGGGNNGNGNGGGGGGGGGGAQAPGQDG
jgi:hypothetical protein